MNTKYLRWVVIIIIVLFLLFLLFWKDTSNKEVNAPSSNNSQNSGSGQDGTQNANELIGVLKVSDDMEKGNMMLVPSEGNIIYLNTTRDFNALIGKEVKVTIDGNLKNFQLVDIVAK